MNRFYSNNTISELNDEQIRRYAPAAFAESPTLEASAKYKFIETLVLMNILRDNGWYPVKARQQRGDVLGTHEISFLKKDSVSGKFLPAVNVGDTFPQVRLINSHNLKKAFSFLGGLYRLVCGNGLLTPIAGMSEKVTTRHIGFAPEKAVKALYNVVETFPAVTAQVQNFQNIVLQPSEQIAYAHSALMLKHKEMAEETPEALDMKNSANPESLLRVYRQADQGRTLWQTYNRVQENLVKGGIQEFLGGNRTREITSIQKDVVLNKALWTLTEEMAKLKMAA